MCVFSAIWNVGLNEIPPLCLIKSILNMDGLGFIDITFESMYLRISRLISPKASDICQCIGGMLKTVYTVCINLFCWIPVTLGYTVKKNLHWRIPPWQRPRGHCFDLYWVKAVLWTGYGYGVYAVSFPHYIFHTGFKHDVNRSLLYYICQFRVAL